MKLELITLKVFDNAPEMYVYKSKLEFEGVKCFVFDEEMISIDPLMSNALGGIKLKVEQKKIEKARSIIKEFENKPLTNDRDELITCPNCNSTNLISGFKSMKGIKGLFAMIVTFLFMSYPLYYKYVYKCKNCDKEFKLNAK